MVNYSYSQCIMGFKCIDIFSSFVWPWPLVSEQEQTASVKKTRGPWMSDNQPISCNILHHCFKWQTTLFECVGCWRLTHFELNVNQHQHSLHHFSRRYVNLYSVNPTGIAIKVQELALALSSVMLLDQRFTHATEWVKSNLYKKWRKCR